jgi:CheY-like chemotaxis protein
MQKIHQGVSMSEILLVEDNPADVFLVREALREHRVECTVNVAAEGQEVLRMLTELPSRDGSGPNLVILDLNLPRHDGIEILQNIRKNSGLSHIPVVVLTSSDSPRDRFAAVALGATRYLRKPSSLEEFLGLGAVFKELLETKRAGQGA